MFELWPRSSLNLDDAGQSFRWRHNQGGVALGELGFEISLHFWGAMKLTGVRFKHLQADPNKFD